MSYIVVSSAYRSTAEPTAFKVKGKSLMNNKNNSGPKIEPGGIPHDIVSFSERIPLAWPQALNFYSD